MGKDFVKVMCGAIWGALLTISIVGLCLWDGRWGILTFLCGAAFVGAFYIFIWLIWDAKSR